MQNVERKNRCVRLHGTFRRNPDLIVSQYRAVVGLDVDGPLPHGLTVDSMIDSILDNDETDSSSSVVLRAIAG